MKNIVRKLKDMIIHRPLVILNKNYYYWQRQLYSAPSRRQFLILKEYVSKNQNRHRECAASILLKSIVGRNSTILDVGANIGYSSIFYSKLLNEHGNGVCISFEPLKKNLVHLNRNVRKLDNVYVVPFGLSDKSEVLRFDLPAYVMSSGKSMQNTGFISAKGLKNSPSSMSEDILCFELDSLLFGIPTKYKTVDYIKIDVEGFELEVLNGAQRVITQSEPIIQLEYNPNTTSVSDFQQILSFAANIDYHVFSFNSDFKLDVVSEVFLISETKRFSLESILTRNNFYKIENLSKC